MKQLKLDFLVVTNRTAIIVTMMLAWNRILLFKQRVILLFNKSSQLLMLWL
jgi:hypothetical protein